VLQFFAVCSSMQERIYCVCCSESVEMSVMQCIAVCCSVLQCVLACGKEYVVIGNVQVCECARVLRCTCVDARACLREFVCV